MGREPGRAARGQSPAGAQLSMAVCGGASAKVAREAEEGREEPGEGRGAGAGAAAERERASERARRADSARNRAPMARMRGGEGRAEGRSGRGQGGSARPASLGAARCAHASALIGKGEPVRKGSSQNFVCARELGGRGNRLEGEPRPAAVRPSRTWLALPEIGVR